MVNHRLIRRLQRRTDLSVAPTASGVANTALTLGDSSSTDGLVMASGVDDGSSSTPTFDIPTSFAAPTSTSGASASSSSASPTSAAASSSSGGISTGTLVGACVGAFLGAALLILLGLWFYKRSAPGPRNPATNRNIQGEHARSRSRLENWNRLEDANDGGVWDGRTEMKQKESDAQTVVNMDGMFKKSTPSVRTMYTIQNEELPPLPVFNLDPHPFSSYHANLAKELATSTEELPQPPAKPFVPQESVNSWDAASGNESFLTMRSRLSGSMSPSLDMARTPALTSSEPHHWESAEVLDFTGHTAEIVDTPPSNNPFVDQTERRKSHGNNPFFGASSQHIPPPPPVFTRTDKGKGREPGNNPFRDMLESQTNSTSSSPVPTDDRAIQSLLAALDHPTDSRVTSTHTMETAISSYSDVDGSYSPPR